MVKLLMINLVKGLDREAKNGNLNALNRYVDICQTMTKIPKAMPRNPKLTGLTEPKYSGSVNKY